MKEPLLISACLLGVGCRYDGRRVEKIDISRLRQRYSLIPVCPEQLGGLPTPRIPSERVGDRVLMQDGTDVTEQFRLGAEEALRLARALGATKALLKLRSPSCGKSLVYDGSFSGTLTNRGGVAAELLLSEGIAVFGEDELHLLLEEN